jgi:hypothetical protein
MSTTGRTRITIAVLPLFVLLFFAHAQTCWTPPNTPWAHPYILFIYTNKD